MTNRRLPWHGGQDSEAAARGRHARPFDGPCIWLEGFVRPRGEVLTIETQPRPEMLEACGLG